MWIALNENSNICHLDFGVGDLEITVLLFVEDFGATTITLSSSVNLQEKIYDIRFNMQMIFFVSIRNPIFIIEYQLDKS